MRLLIKVVFITKHVAKSSICLKSFGTLEYNLIMNDSSINETLCFIYMNFSRFVIMLNRELLHALYLFYALL